MFVLFLFSFFLLVFSFVFFSIFDVVFFLSCFPLFYSIPLSSLLCFFFSFLFFYFLLFRSLPLLLYGFSFLLGWQKLWFLFLKAKMPHYTIICFFFPYIISKINYNNETPSDEINKKIFLLKKIYRNYPIH